MVAIVPVIVSSCTVNSSGNGSSNDNSNNNNGEGTNDGNIETTTKITPELKSSQINLSGKLSEVFKDGLSNVDSNISSMIQKNLETFFKDGGKLKEANPTVKVESSFNSTHKYWTGDTYEKWIKKVNDSNILKVKSFVYSDSLPKLNISSLDDLYTQIYAKDKGRQFISNVIKAAGEKISGAYLWVVDDKLGLTNSKSTTSYGATDNDVVLHVSAIAIQPRKSMPIDIQIPVSSINLDLSNCKVLIEGNDKVNETSTTASVKYNIGINSKVNFDQPTNTPTITNANATNVNEALVSLGYATKSKDGTYTLNNYKISTGLGIFNCSFKPKSIVEKSTTKTYTITITTTPNDGYVWEDGDNASKDLTFDVNFNVTN